MNVAAPRPGLREDIQISQSRCEIKLHVKWDEPWSKYTVFDVRYKNIFAVELTPRTIG